MPDFGPRWKCRDLGQGGQAYTFVVQRRDGADDREYVLKRLKNLKRVERFEREIEVCAKFQHPNVLTIVERGEARGKPFLVTEYCTGGSLAEHPRPIGTPVLSVLEIFQQVCAGVAYAQDKGIVHRDIKPDNIFLRGDGTAVLGDFGICFVDDDGKRLTMTDEVAGSRFYCAPELRDGRLEDGVPQTAVDVYSLGKVLYRMLSGGNIFDRGEHREDKYRLGQHDPLNPDYELVNQLLDVAIVQDWRKRISTPSKLLAKVEDVMRVVAAGGHALTLSVPHRCMFCARGEYKVAVDMTRPLPAGAPNQGFRHAQDSSDVRNFGFTPIGNATWIILVCEVCGHVLTFRPDRARHGLQNWKRN